MELIAFFCIIACIQGIFISMIIVLLVCTGYTVSSACTRGFMELDLLYKRASTSSGSVSMNFLGVDAQLCIVPDVSFSCSGNIIGLLLGATIKGTIGRTLYPEIQVWRRNSNKLNYTRLASQEIRLNPGDFSPDGVLQYNLTTPISFQSGDVLGVYQPMESNSVVKVYYHDVMMSTMYCSPFASNPPSSLTEGMQQSLTVMNGKQLLIIITYN